MLTQIQDKFKMKKPLNVLIFPGGTENGLEILKSLASSKEFCLFAVSNDSINHAPYVFKNHFSIKDVGANGWQSDLNEIINKEKIDLIFPANSIVIDALSSNRSQINAEIILPPHELIEITRSKTRTLSELHGIVPTPQIFSYQKINKDNLPLFIKPDHGYGSQGATVIKDISQLSEYSENHSSFIIQELLPGTEYTIDCFSDSSGKLLFSSGRKRTRIRMGTSMHAEDVDKSMASTLNEMAQKISNKLKVPGLWFFQVKVDNKGTLKLLEVDIRVAGTMCQNRCKGVNFPKLAILQHIGIPISVLTNKHNIILDRALINRYKINLEYTHIYVDLDDTLVIHNKLNIQLVSLLFQAIQRNVKIILISKSLSTNKVEFLERFRILQIFDEIIWLQESDKKSDYIKEKTSIFIDDSFSQRLEVSLACGIPTFDPSMVEALLDERQ